MKPKVNKMKFFVTTLLLFLAVSLHAANPAYTDFRGTNEVLVTTNPATGKIIIGPATPISTQINAAQVWTNLSTNVTVLLQDTNVSIYSDPSKESFGFGYQVFQGGRPDFDNTAFGYQALNALGVNAVNKNQENTAIGSLALSSATNSQWNTAIGYDAMLRLKKGSGNVAIGPEALNHIIPTTIGDLTANPGENTSVGYNSSTTIDSGQRNAVLGAYAGTIRSDSSSNVVVGFNSFGVKQDVILGDNANLSAANSRGNVIIGSQADNPSDKTNAVAIGWGSRVGNHNEVHLGNNFTTTVVTSGYIVATNGFATILDSTSTNTLITVGSSPFNFTNTASQTIVLYLDANGATTTANLNGQTIFKSLAAGDHTIILKPGAYTTITYAIATPIMTWTEL